MNGSRHTWTDCGEPTPDPSGEIAWRFALYQLLVFVLALLVAFALPPKAHADEMQDQCRLWAPSALSEVYDRMEGGMEPALVRHLMLTEPGLGDAGRWFLWQFIYAVEVSDALGEHKSRDNAVVLGLTLCAISPPGQIPQRQVMPITYREI